jgi:hypothetical protein
VPKDVDETRYCVAFEAMNRAERRRDMVDLWVGRAIWGVIIIGTGASASGAVYLIIAVLGCAWPKL